MWDTVLAKEDGREKVYGMHIQQKAKNKCFPSSSECISEDEDLEDSVKGHVARKAQTSL